MDDDEWVMVDPVCNKRKRADKGTEGNADGATRKSGKVRKADKRGECDAIEGTPPETRGASVISAASRDNIMAPSKSTTPQLFSDDDCSTRGQLPFHKFMSSEIQVLAPQYKPWAGHSDVAGIEEEQCPLHLGLKETIPGHRYQPYSEEQLLRAIAPEEISDSGYRAGQGKTAGRLESGREANLALFLMGNRLRCRPYDIELVYRWCDDLRATSVLDHLRSLGGPIADSIIEQIIPVAIRKEDIDMASAILDYGFALKDLRFCTDDHNVLHNADCQLPPLHFACHVGSVAGVRFLLDRAADPNQLFPVQFCPSITPMDCILRFKRRWRQQNDVADQIIQILIDAGANDAPKAKEETLISALREHDFDVAARLLSAGVKPREYSDGNWVHVPPIFMALRRDDDVVVQEVLIIVRQLLDAGVDVNENCEGWSARKLFNTNEDDVSDIWDGNLTRDSTGSPDPPGAAGFSEVSSEDSNRPIWEDRSFDSPRPPIQYAAEQWDCNVDLMRLLIAAGARVEQKLVHFFVKCGAKDCLALLAEISNAESKKDYQAWVFASAIRYGNLELAKQTIASMSTVFFSEDLCKATKMAVKKGYTETIQWIISTIPCHQRNISLAPFRYNHISTGLGSALRTSIVHGLYDITELLIEGGADVNGMPVQRTSYYRTPLLEAVTKGNWKLCKKLLRRGAYCDFDYFEKDSGISYPCSVLPTAVAAAPRSFIKTLIEKGANPDAFELPYGRCALSGAISRGKRSIIQLLIDAGADVNGRVATKHNPKNAPLAVAVQTGSRSLVNLLLELGADPCEHALCAAVKSGDEFVVTILNARKAKYGHISNRFACRALHDAIFFKKSGTVDLFLSHGINPSTNVIDGPFRFMRDPHYSTSPLGFALLNVKYKIGGGFEPGKDRRILEKLLESKADFDAIIYNRPDLDKACTPLLIAIDCGDILLLKRLLEKGASINRPAIGEVRRTPLQLAAEQGNIEIVDLLLKEGAEVNALPNPCLGRTALQMAAAEGFLGIALLLLRNGADPNAAPAKIGGYTALEGAAKYGRIDMIQLLLNWGVVFYMPHRDQYEIAKRMAGENGNAAACLLLEESFISHNE